MLVIDDVTHVKGIHPLCPDCGSKKLKADGEPFYIVDLFLIIPLICTNCGYESLTYLEVCYKK